MKRLLKRFFPASARTTNARFDAIERRYADMERVLDKMADVQQKNLQLSEQLLIAANTIEQHADEFNHQVSRLEQQMLSTSEYYRSFDKIFESDGAKEIQKDLTMRVHTNKPITDISKQMWDVVGKEAAQFASDYLYKAKVFKTPADLRKYGASLCDGNGLWLEFGVYSGASINQIAKLYPKIDIYGFDSFEGLPEDWRTNFRQGSFRTKSLPSVEDNVKLVVGLFDKTLPGFANEHSEMIAYLHIDCDLYSSTKCIFDELGDRIIGGTVIVFDEFFNYPGWRHGEYKAFMEFMDAKQMNCEYIGYVPTFQQVAVKIL